MATRKKGSAQHIDRIPRWIGEEDILRPTTKGWYIGSRRLAQDEVSALKAEAAQFEKSFLWDLMRKDIHYIAYLKATNQAANEKDIFYANAMYRNLEILEKFLENAKTF